MFKKILYLILLILTTHSAVAQQSVRIGFYNVENLFDTIRDPSINDVQMLPQSDLEWNSTKYHNKIESIANIIKEMDYPTIMGFAEVENSSVIEDIILGDALKDIPYRVCHFDSPDKRGIDVALIFRNDHFQLKEARAFAAHTNSPTRDILMVKGILHNKPLSIIVVHLPSRIGGERFTEPSRIACAKQIKALADSLIYKEQNLGLIIMGDMNDNPKDRSLKEILCAQTKVKNISSPHDLYNPFAKLHRQGQGTTYYNGRWNMYDNIIISGNILLTERKVSNIKPFVFKLPSLLNSKGKPLPTYRDLEYIGGISDHLPIFVDIEWDM